MGVRYAAQISIQRIVGCMRAQSRLESDASHLTYTNHTSLKQSEAPNFVTKRPQKVFDSLVATSLLATGHSFSLSNDIVGVPSISYSVSVTLATMSIPLELVSSLSVFHQSPNDFLLAAASSGDTLDATSEM